MVVNFLGWPSNFAQNSIICIIAYKVFDDHLHKMRSTGVLKQNSILKHLSTFKIAHSCCFN